MTNPAAWPQGQTFELPNFKVTLSAPVLVARSKGYCWFPSLAQLANGDLFATMSNYADVHTEASTSFNTFSGDGGRTWSEPVVAPYGESTLRLPSGDQVFLPYYMRPRPDGMAAPYKRIPQGTREIIMEDEVIVTGWPRRDRSPAPELGISGFVFNGQPVELKSGGYLATLYGWLEEDERYNLVAAESADGMHWTVRSIVADHNCPLPGSEGPCESAMCRLQDGRLMCVFRLASNVPYGQTWSSDEGHTWSTPVAMDNVFSVQPSLAVMADGAIALSGGRPGVYLWLNADGTGKGWEQIDLMAHHNAHCPQDQIATPENTSAYTEVIALNETQLLCIYDRAPHSWAAIPEDSDETNSVWVVRATVERRG